MMAEGETVLAAFSGKWQSGLVSPVVCPTLLLLCPLLLPGPPDAPLDVQIEPGPSPGILVISWLPVTIDAAGTSNGVRVTGYAIYADGQKVWPGDSVHLYPGSRKRVSPCHAQRPGLSLAQKCPAPGIWVLGSGLAKSMGFGSS